MQKITYIQEINKNLLWIINNIYDNYAIAVIQLLTFSLNNERIKIIINYLSYQFDDDI